MQVESAQIKLDETGLRKHILTLTDSQKQFVDLIVAWSKTPQKTLTIISGGPGTGKSHIVKNTLDYVKVQQLRMSYTARSAQAIAGRTIHSTLKINPKGLCYDLEIQLENESNLIASIKASKHIYNEFKYDEDPLIVVIDEVSMVNGWLMYWLIRFFMDRTAQPLFFIAIGDPHQLNPVMSIHNLFSFDFSGNKWNFRRVHLKESKRFVPEYNTIINALRVHVDNANESALFALICQHFTVYESIEGTLLAQADRAMAYRTSRVDYFNNYYIKNMVAGPEINIDDILILKPECLVLITSNGCSSVTNGTELIFICYSKKNDIIICKKPKTGEKVNIRRHHSTKQFPITVGFAATIHKFQGDTIDGAKIVIDFEGNRNLNMAYTAVSRVRHINQIIGISL